MRDRRKEIKERIAKRKKLNRTAPSAKKNATQTFIPDYDTHQPFEWFSNSSGSEEERSHPLFNREAFLFKILASATLVLVVAILFQNPSSKLEQARHAVESVMKNEFQFAMIYDWYEETFGKPLALLPESQPPVDEVESESKEYALPANAKILEDFDSTNQGITIQTANDAVVEAVQEGTVTFAGVHEDFGNTVIVQHPDTSETWYGHLGEIFVKDYDYVKAGDELGKVSSVGSGNSGEFYFALKKDEKFIDPVQVIKFE